MMRGRLQLTFASVGLAIFCVSAIGQGDQDLPPLIKQMLEASKRLRYSGERRIEVRFGPDMVKHTEFILKDGHRTRIWFPDEGTFRGQIIVENETARKHYFPDRNQIDVMPPRREEFSQRFLRFNKPGKPKVEFVIESGGQIAGVSTKKVNMVGPNSTVFMSMWIDPQTGLVLKRVLFNKRNQPEATAEFVKVNYRPTINRGDFELKIDGAKVITPHDRLAEMLQKGDFQNVSLPPKGPFKLESARILRIDGVPALVQVYVKKDGRVSLYQTKAAIDPGKLRRFARDEKLGVYTWQRSGVSFALVGDLSDNLLRDIAQRLGGG
jgi:outer membrane lipoprotein-sorting protein